MTKQIVLLEFNELTPRLIEQFIDEGHLPSFRKLHDSSKIFTTDARAEGENLNPWVQWVTVHTGLTPTEHQVYRLNEAYKCKGRFLWDTFSKKGITSWICGSMNVDHEENFKGLFIPDPWSERSQPYPIGKFDKYFDYVAQSVQSHSNKDHVPALDFVKFMLQNGLSLRTIYKLSSQLVKEKINHMTSWRRALLLDWVQYDLFNYHFKKNQPRFATFFSNSVAHCQHHYWRDFEPLVFGNDKPKKETSNAIREAYINTDKIVGDFLKYAGDEVVIMFCTALSQQPYLESDRYYYHINDKDSFIQLLQIQQSVKYAPVMAEQFHLICTSQEDAEALKIWLDNFEMESKKYFHVGSKQVFLTSVEGSTVHVQCRCTKEVDRNAKILNKNDYSSLTFYSVFYEMDEAKSGVHHPFGMFWIYDKSLSHQIENTPIPLEQVHSMIREYFP